MSRKNSVKIVTRIAESSGYHFKSSADDSSYVIASKHGLCHKSDDCGPYNNRVTDCCKSCSVTFDLTDVELRKKDGLKLTAQKIFVFPNNDISIIKVTEKSQTPLKLGKVSENTGSYVAYGYKSEKTEPGRLLLSAPEINDDECYFNIDSFSTPELVEKSEDYYGVSGSLVIDRTTSDIPVAYSVITTNEESNDLSGDLLYDIDFNELHDFFGSKIFSKQRCKVSVDTSFKEHFKEIDAIQVNTSLCVSVLIPTQKGFPHFNLNPIAESLTNEFDLILGSNPKNKAMNTVSALRVLEEKKELLPVYKLLSSRIVESMMNAPHIYSTYIDDSHYHHMHLLNDTENGMSFVISSFGGEGDLTEKFNFALNQMVYNINHYSLSTKLISERAFLDMKYSHEECELLYEVLFGDHSEVIDNLSIIHCIDLQSSLASNDVPVEEQIKEQVKQAISNIDKMTLNMISQGLNVSLYVIPTNRSNELTEIMESLLK
ncbi:hypothetical protein [Vibrio vulnificus]|uniref:hypothetical protein n=2 Tax=Vibrio vulnificus TaxID=672 RepID=UPI0021FACDFC|nr:hypothetical protein [Vibrio vulnificus]BDP32886.1 hypothetical protein VV208B2_39660 [Vibrio vulnificus]HBH7891937.1 hypothetical protein [Vibrio vulnificus]